MTRSILAGATLSALLALSACSSNDDGGDAVTAGDADVQGGDNMLPGEMPEPNPGDSMLNPDLEPEPPSEEASGDDTSAIEGLWDASVGPEGRRDVKYVDISADGLHTTYDLQQDDVTGGDNCHIVSPRRLDLESGEAASGTYSVSGERGFMLTESDDPDTLIVTYIDEDGESAAEAMPEAWPRRIGDTVENLTVCDDG